VPADTHTNTTKKEITKKEMTPKKKPHKKPHNHKKPRKKTTNVTMDPWSTRTGYVMLADTHRNFKKKNATQLAMDTCNIFLIDSCVIDSRVKKSTPK